MIPTALSDAAFLEDVRAANRRDDQFRVWWLGQSGFLLQFSGRHLLLDPYLSDSLTAKYAGTSQPHIRMTELVIEPRQLDFIDVVTSSHRHTDHLDGDTLIPLLRVNPQLEVLVPAAQLEFSAERLQVDPNRLTAIDVGQCLELGGFSIHAVTAAHESLEQDAAGHCAALGYVVRFGDWTVYHSGDTVLHSELLERLAEFSIDLALLPINGRAPQRHVAGNFWGTEAAQLANQLGCQLVIPCHFEMFSFNSVTPDEFVMACQNLAQPYCVLRAGQRWESVRLKPRS